MTSIRFPSDTSEDTSGEHRDETGRLAPMNSPAIREITGAEYTTPAHSHPHSNGPTMAEIYSRRNMQRIRSEVLQAPEIDLTGYMDDSDDLGKLVTMEASNV